MEHPRALYSLSEGVNDLLPQNLLHVPVTQREGREEHGVQHGGAGEEAGKREGCVSPDGFAAAVRTKALCSVTIGGFYFSNRPRVLIAGG